jgi:hypothetical protein
MAYDSERRHSVVFGGYHALSGMPPYSDTWTYDGHEWSLGRFDPSPPRTPHGAMVFDSARKEMVLAVGEEQGAFQTWEFDGSSWRQVTTSTTPPLRQGHAMAYDQDREKVVLFGGTKSEDFSDTWEYDGMNWSLVPTSEGPSPRRSHAMTYDQARGVVLLFGGKRGDEYLDDTWTYDGVWRRQPQPDPPAPRRGHAMVYDARREKSVLFGGRVGPDAMADDLWEHDGATWTLLPTPDVRPMPRRDHGMAYDSHRQRVVLFGGLAQLEFDTNYVSDTWEFFRAE